MIYDNALIVATQVLVLFLLIGVGYWTRRKLLIDGTGLRQLTNLFQARCCYAFHDYQGIPDAL